MATLYRMILVSRSFRGSMVWSLAAAIAIVAAPIPRGYGDEPPTREEAVEAMHRAVAFFRDQASAGGGYVFRWSEDLSLREGEGKVGDSTAWIEPPATPAVGLAYLNAYRLTDDPILLDAARQTVAALIQGQMVSGGWGEKIEFAPRDRARYAYRVDSKDVGKRRNTSTLDDNKTQSSLRFLMQLDSALEFRDAKLHEAARFGLDRVLDAQYRNGAWPQRFDGPNNQAEVPIVQASYPSQSPKTYPKQKYDSFYTLNDNTHCDVIATMWEAWDTYQDPRYKEAAVRGGDFLLLAQMPEPQPGWAQQYDYQMHPVWARKFEPPSISGGESQRAMQMLLHLFRRTGDKRYLQAVRTALPYFNRSLREDGRLPRFLELQTNRPLYLTRDYAVTYNDNDLPTHYSFVVKARLDSIEKELNRLESLPPDQLWPPGKRKSPKMSDALAKAASQRIDSLDQRGAWVEKGKLKTHAQTPGGRIISSATFIKNLNVLAEYVAAANR
ncbi:Pectic acid lyase [Rosistilla ulvae]|uniref:Pectic acid lyase n=1 Tax=Rosistilla ulvae TaxID=1930277 RepID=A0A517LXA2_9BACT|nr:pectate lyase [Rosistilla ulvae]QDS87254.1 Pectic acid lyase [Rosistilla ulvae]